MRSDRVGELGVVLDLLDHADDFRRHLLVELHVAFELGDDRARQRLGLDALADDVVEHDGIGFVIVAAVGVLEHLGALRALDQHLHGAVGQLEQLQHAGERADLVDRVGRRIVVGGVLLRREQNERVRAHHLFERLDRLFAADEQRHDHVREHHDVAQRQHRIGPGFARVSGGRGFAMSWPKSFCCAPPSMARDALPRWSAVTGLGDAVPPPPRSRIIGGFGNPVRTSKKYKRILPQLRSFERY